MFIYNVQIPVPSPGNKGGQGQCPQVLLLLTFPELVPVPVTVEDPFCKLFVEMIISSRAFVIFI